MNVNDAKEQIRLSMRQNWVYIVDKLRNEYGVYLQAVTNKHVSASEFPPLGSLYVEVEYQFLGVSVKEVPFEAIEYLDDAFESLDKNDWIMTYPNGWSEKRYIASPDETWWRGNVYSEWKKQYIDSLQPMRLKNEDLSPLSTLLAYIKESVNDYKINFPVHVRGHVDDWAVSLVRVLNELVDSNLSNKKQIRQIHNFFIEGENEMKVTRKDVSSQPQVVGTQVSVTQLWINLKEKSYGVDQIIPSNLTTMYRVNHLELYCEGSGHITGEKMSNLLNQLDPKIVTLIENSETENRNGQWVGRLNERGRGMWEDIQDTFWYLTDNEKTIYDVEDWMLGNGDDWIDESTNAQDVYDSIQDGDEDVLIAGGVDRIQQVIDDVLAGRG